MTDEEKTLFGKPVDEYVKANMSRLHAVLKLSMELKGLQSYSDYRGVNRTMATFRKALNKIIQDVLYHQDISLRLGDETLLEDKFELLRDANDCFLERINSELDDAQGIRRLGTMDLPQPALTTVSASSRGNNAMVLTASRNVQKPQLFFTEKVDNSAKTPFMPIITDKPNNKKPLAIMLCITEDGKEFYSHPYELELQHWSPDERMLSTRVEPVPPSLVEATPFVMVDSADMLDRVVKDLRDCTHVAVDVEHHAFRSYLGLTSLIQISSRTKDYIVDPIKLRGQLTPLNEIFTHPMITKVLHGADHDVLWLQRDCGLYLVNLFDTHIAAVVLDFPQRSLAALLQTFCNIQADKRYQRADWRIRPLPADFIQYARQDTHYLLYIHDMLHNMLLERANDATNLIVSVYDRSIALCLQRYEKPEVTPDSYLQLYRRSRKLFNNQQEYALRQLFLWRDKVARDHDESTDFVLPRHMLLQIAEVLPKEMQGVLACCNPIPPLVKTELLNIHSIIRDARDQPLHTTVQSRVEIATIISGSRGSTYCLHDLSALEENDSKPGLLEGNNSKAQGTIFGDLFEKNKILLKETSDLFGGITKTAAALSKASEALSQWLSPFQRYRLYKDSKVKLPQFEKEQKSTKRSPQQPQQNTSSLEDERVSRVREHFLALAGPSTEGSYHRNQQPAVDQDELRVARMLAHYKSVTQSGTGSSSDGGGTPTHPSIGVEGPLPKRSVVIKTTTFEAPVSKEEGELGDDSSDSDSSYSDDSDSEFETAAPAAVSANALKEVNSNDVDSDGSSSSDDSDSNATDNDEKDSRRAPIAEREEGEVTDSSSTSDDSSEEEAEQQDDLLPEVKESSKKTSPVPEDSNEGPPRAKKMKVAHKKQATGEDRAAGADGTETVKVSNKAVKRKSGEMEVEPFNYDSANFKMFATNRSRGRGRKNQSRGRSSGGRGRGGSFSPRGGRGKGGPARGRK